MPLNEVLHLEGVLEGSEDSLRLRVTGGSHWELGPARTSRHLIGHYVEVAGRRSGFNAIACDRIWLAGDMPPAVSRYSGEFVATAVLVGFGMLAFIASLARYFG